MFQLYLVFIIVLLMPICYLVILQIFKLFSRAIVLSSLISSNKNLNMNKDEILSLAKIYINKKQWLSCILMLEFYASIDKNNLNVAEYYNSIGFCYQLIDLNHLAKDYYCKANIIFPENIIFLKNLAKIHTISKDFLSAIKVYKQILLLDPTYQTAIDSLHALSLKYAQ